MDTGFGNHPLWHNFLWRYLQRRDGVRALSPNGGGGWTEAVLHSFGLGADGVRLTRVALIMDAAGNLYGIANGGGYLWQSVV